MNDEFTASAARALQQAGRIAAQRSAAETEGIDLLLALLQEENRAVQLLEACGIRASHVVDALPNGLTLLADDLSTHAGFPPHGDSFKASLLEARIIAKSVGSADQIGSEHLLVGLARGCEVCANHLADHGATVLLLKQQFQTEEQHDLLAAEPLDVSIVIRTTDPSIAENSALYRILDASANRCREGLRVAEDFARFALNDKHLARLLKTLRHDFSTAMQDLPLRSFLAARDTPNDVGTQVSTVAEQQRHSLRDVALAAMKRSQEALRTLEENTKVVSPSLPARLQRIRYESYTLEQALMNTAMNLESLDGQRICLLVTADQCLTGVETVVRKALANGVRMIQIREKSRTDRELIEFASPIRRWTREYDALLIMNDRPDLAIVTEADGVHVGQDEMRVADVRKLVGGDKLIGVSTHSLEQARQAVLDGADYLGVGPTFPSATKNFTEFPGLEFVQQVAEEIALPWFAIGGIDERNLPSVLQAGATRLAVSGAINRSPYPGDITSDLLHLMDRFAVERESV